MSLLSTAPTCTSPPRIRNASPSLPADGDVYASDEVVTYTCDAGFELVGLGYTAVCYRLTLWNMPEPISCIGTFSL